jgi:hypothetical protein
MSAKIVDTTEGVLTIKFTGKLRQPELAAVQRSARELVEQHGKVRVLAVVEDFLGWEKGGDWGDLSLQMEVDPHIEKMAIVGERRWEELALIFAAKGLRRFPIEYFQPAELGRARAWLASKGLQANG